MNIQYIGANESRFNHKDITCSTMESPKGLDDFNLNIIDFNDSHTVSPIYLGSNHFELLREMIENTGERVLILLPYTFKNEISNTEQKYSIENIVNKLTKISCRLIFGSTETLVNKNKLDSEFHFIKTFYFSDQNYDGKHSQFKVYTTSSKGKQPTTVSEKNVSFTTLKVTNSDELKDLLIEMDICEKNIHNIPEWMEGIEMFDDRQQMDTIQIKEKEIQELKSKITAAQEILIENERLKSILYTQSDSLVEVVFEIFEEIFNLDLSEFEDKKIEDISFVVGEMTFIGEIKGITSNVKTSNLSQLDNHYTNFVEEHPEIPENRIYKLLIINHQRKKPVSERDPIDHKQIELAENKYTSLIIETSELLKLLEKYREKSISKEEVVDLLTKNGLLKIE